MSREPKLMFFDIETSPNIVYSWAVGRDISLSTDNIINERKIIMISYKFAGEKKVHRLTWNKRQCDKAMLRKFIKVAKTADALIGHNGDRFDVKWVKTRALIHGLEPLNNVVTVDTLKLARGNFNFNSNRLDYLGKMLVNDRKVDTGGFGLWVAIMNGDQAALRKMGKYCDQDVVLLEKVFNKIAPHVKNLPVHLGTLSGKSRLSCEACGSSHVHANREYPTKTQGIKKVITCQDCGSSRAIPKKLYLKLKGDV
jgi:predicted PolB exonuclease-like 3'-5' exonuclease